MIHARRLVALQQESATPESQYQHVSEESLVPHSLIMETLKYNSAQIFRHAGQVYSYKTMCYYYSQTNSNTEDCEWEYRNCGSCSATCGSATRQCTPFITKSAKHGGKECPDFVRRGERQTLQCENLPSCPPGETTLAVFMPLERYIYSGLYLIP